MSDQELDRMYEAAIADEWEEQNRDSVDGETLRQAARSIRLAIEDFDTSCDLVNEASELLVDTPEGDRISSVLDDMEKILDSMKEMQRKWEMA